MHCHTLWGTGKCNSCHTLLDFLGEAGSATPAMHRLTARGQWAVELLQYNPVPPGGSGQWNSRDALPHCLWAMAS